MFISVPDRIRIRQKVTDPYGSGSGSGSATLRPSVARSLQAFTATPSKNHSHLGTFHSHQIFVITAMFLASFPATFTAFPHRSCYCWRVAAEVVPSLVGVPCLKLSFLLLLGSLLLPTSLLLLTCHKLVWLTATNFPRTSDI
jgi:hypothetical protein